MQSIENKVINRIYGHGRGWSFFKNDFLDLGSPISIDTALHRLTKKGTIRRAMRGIYDYPKFSKLLNKNQPPDINQVAHAQARKYGWNIQVTGNTALNILGLSTQVPTRYIYLSDAKSKKYKVGRVELEFKKDSFKDMRTKHQDSALLVQALKALNRKSLTEKEQKIVRAYYKESDSRKIVKDTQYSTNWVHEEIKRIFKKY